MNRNVVILAFCQAMLFTGIGLVISSSALIGKQLAPSPAWATLPLAIQYLTTLLMIFYVSRLMSQHGRGAGGCGGHPVAGLAQPLLHKNPLKEAQGRVIYAVASVATTPSRGLAPQTSSTRLM